MNDTLLSNLERQAHLQKQFQTKYDPFKNPPDLKLAQLHRKATKIGRIPSDLSEQLIVCPCCENIVNKTQFGILCNVDQFAFMGVGYTLFFVLYKYFTAILFFVFIVSGGAFFFFASIQCSQPCIRFFGIPIMSQKKNLSQSVKETQVMHIVTAVLILIMVIIVKHFISYDINRIQRKTLCPSQYTIMMQNLPRRTLDVVQFKTWVEQKMRCTPILVNVAYDTSQFFKATQKRQQLAIERNQLRIKLRKMIRSVALQDPNNSLQLTNIQLRNQIQSIQKKIKEQDRIVEGFCNNQAQLKQVGTVFVTFNSADEVQRILEVHEKTFANILFAKFTALFYSEKLEFQGYQVTLCRAPAPKQIIWENLEFSYFRHLLFEFCLMLSMGLFILLTFRFQFWFVSYMYRLRHQGQLTGRKDIIAQALAMSLIIMVLNMMLRIAVRFITGLRKSYSFTRQQSSFCSYYSLAFIINTCFTIYMVHGSSLDNQNQLLLVDIHTLMLTNAFSEPLFKLFDPMMWIKMLRRYRIKKMDPYSNPLTQSYIHRLWEGYQISNADNYQYIIRVLFITVWFSNIAPLGVLLSLLAMLLDYWIIKFLFTKVYRQPKNLSKNIIKSLNFIQLLPLVYIAGILPFLYHITFTLSIQTFFELLFHYGITIVVIFFCILGYLYKFRPQNKFVTDKKYSDVDLAFGFNYQTQNPFTKFTGEKRFLEQILRKQRTPQSQHLIKNILDIHQTSVSQFQNKKPYLNKLKLSLLRRVESRMQNNQPFQLQMNSIQPQDQGLHDSFLPHLNKNKKK